MAGHSVRKVNVIPHVKVKKEVIDDEEDTVTCKVCCKGFCTETALRNHARMEHTDTFAKADPSLYTQHKSNSKEKEIEMKIKTEKFISTMGPTDLMSLASNDVSYIIIKSETPEPEPERKRKAPRAETSAKPEKAKRVDKDGVQTIPGPFECLGPSSLVADGTCHQIFFSCCKYSLHYRDEHTRRRKGHRCQVCEKPLLGSGEEATTPYPCGVCGAGFQTNKELSEHMAVVHIKLKPFECNVCHKRFTQQGGVQQHMRMHTGDRPFSCTFCPKAFTQKSGLDQHLRIHTKVKPYRCVICSKTFCQSVHLKQHMRTHTNVAPHQCSICSKRFKQSSHLNYHLKNHNPATMTDDQRAEYNKAITAITKDIKNKGNRKIIVSCEEKRFMYMNVEGEMQLVEVEVPGDGEVPEIQITEESEVSEEQLLAEQSIQDDPDTYILGDDWTVQGEEEEDEEEEGEDKEEEGEDKEDKEE